MKVQTKSDPFVGKYLFQPTHVIDSDYFCSAFRYFPQKKLCQEKINPSKNHKANLECGNLQMGLFGFRHKVLQLS